MADSIDSFPGQWSAAGQAGDTGRLGTLLAGDLTAAGPLGFTLPRQARLARHRSGDLRYDSFGLTEVQARAYGQAAAVTARTNTGGSYQGRRVPAATRATLVLVQGTSGWRLAAIHLGFIAGTAGAPPIPGAVSRPQGHRSAA